MKNTQYTLTYVAALIVGALLLIFSGSANIFEYIVMIIGILIVIPSAYGVYRGFAGKKGNNENGKKTGGSLLTAFESVLGLILGIWMICNPSFFVHYLIYTLGIILILAGVLQIINMVNASRDMGGINGSLYIMPSLTMIAGLVIVISGPEKIATAANIITGIVLVLYAINGLITSGMHYKVVRDITKENAREVLQRANEAKEEKEAEKKKTDEEIRKAHEEGRLEGIKEEEERMGDSPSSSADTADSSSSDKKENE